MRFTLFLFILFSNYSLFSQTYCDNLEFGGIYFNSSNEDRIYLVLINNGTNNEPSNSNYTSIILLTDSGDTISSGNLTYEYTLPTVVNEKIIYPLSIHEDFDSYKDLPSSFTGSIQTFVPECNVNFSYSNESIESLPSDLSIDCQDYALIDIIKDRFTNIKYAYAIIHSTVKDSALLNTGYTSFEFFNEDNESLSYVTEPSHFLPSFPQDTFAYEMQFTTFIDSVLCGYLQLENPDCKISFCNKVNFIEEDDLKVNVYPNPAKSFINIQSPFQIEYVDILDSQGRSVLTTKVYELIHIEQLNSGSYFVVVHFKNKHKRTISFTKTDG